MKKLVLGFGLLGLLSSSGFASTCSHLSGFTVGLLGGYNIGYSKLNPLENEDEDGDSEGKGISANKLGYDGVFGGALIGLDYVASSGAYMGFEINGNISGAGGSAAAQGDAVGVKVRNAGNLGFLFKFGYAWGSTLPYAILGYSLSRMKATIIDEENISKGSWYSNFATGMGMSVALTTQCLLDFSTTIYISGNKKYDLEGIQFSMRNVNVLNAIAIKYKFPAC
jgi:hypothetical protein